MKHIYKIVLGIIFLIASSAQAYLYTAENIEISGEGETPVVAKNNAITQGELDGFTQVIRSLVGVENEAFVERPSDSEILEMVNDISILEEKNTATSYWGKINVRFKESSIQNLLKKNKQTYLEKVPPTYWLIPIFRQGDNETTLEDDNPFYQALKTQNNLSDFFKMILPDGDIDELVLVENALQNQDFSSVLNLAKEKGFERILTVMVQYAPDNSWKMAPVSYGATENIFDDVFVQGFGLNSLTDGWHQLNSKMTLKWREKFSSNAENGTTYYARINVQNASDWGKLEPELKRMSFLENLVLQGAMKNQLLIRFSYQGSFEKLSQQLSQKEWTWLSDTSTLGTLKRKDTYEDTL